MPEDTPEDGRETEAELRYVSGLQRLLVEISRRFLDAGSGADFDAHLNDALARVGAWCGVDRCYVFHFDDTRDVHVNTHEWCAADVAPQIDQLQAVANHDLPHLVTRIRQGQVIQIRAVSELRDTWPAEYGFFDALGIRSLLLVPLPVAGEIHGHIGFDAVRHERSWNEEEVRQLQGLADLVGAAIDRKRIEDELRETRALLGIAGRMARVGGWRVDLSTNRILWSDEVCAIHELPPGTSMRLEDGIAFYAPESRELIEKAFNVCTREGVSYDEELEIITARGNRVAVRAIGEAVRDEDGHIVEVRGALQDISQQKAAQQEIQRLAERLWTTLESITDAFLTLDLEWRFTYVNRQVERIVQRSREEMLGQVIWEAFPDTRDSEMERQYRHAMATGESTAFEYYYPGLESWFELNIYPSEHGLAVYFRDITERKRALEKAEYLALYDPLTDLPNRRLLQDRLHTSLAAHTREGDSGAVLFLDLDHFKTINDTLGHEFGDLLLKEVAHRLQSNLRGIDTVARFGGDEFVIVLSHLDRDTDKASHQAESIAHKVVEALTRPYHIDGHERHLTVSIGIALFGGSEDTAEDLMKRVDLAMYRAKEAGRGIARHYEPEMRSRIDFRVQLEGELRQALERNEIVAYYQPQVDATGRMIGAEALARWHHPERGLVTPDEFIPVAEESGLILPLGKRILEQVCGLLCEWRNYGDPPVLPIHVNVSARQFHDAGFVRTIRDVLDRSGVPGHLLGLELTESLLLADVDDTVITMERLREMGLRFALDDFGTGYSSLAYLKRLPLDSLKIDRAFVQDAGDNPNDAAIVRTIVLLADALGLAVIAEGVETEPTRELLESYDCRAYQGWLFSHALPADEFTTYARARAVETAQGAPDPR